MITMNYREHNPPHFHARYGEYKVVVGINDFSVIDGHLPSRAFLLVLEWAVVHKNELLKNWDVMMEKRQPYPIDPLQ